MRSSHSLDRVDTAFDGTQLVADAGLLLPATLAQHLGLRELVERHLDLGRKPGQANRGDKFLAIVTGGATSGPLAVISNIAFVVAIGGLALQPVAIGIAVLRYRLFEIDRLISRTIGYGVLTLILAGLFVAVILL